MSHIENSKDGGIKMKIGIDIDGTIKKTQQAAIKLYNEELDMNIKEDEVTTFYLDKPYGLSMEEGKRIWRKLEGRIYTIGVPLKNAAESLQLLADEGHELYFITARPAFKKIEEITKEWLKKHKFPFNGDNLYMNAQQKGKVARKLGIDLFFEDDPTHIDNLLEHQIPVIIVDTHYNREYTNEIPRITNWDDGLKYVHHFDKILKS